MLCATVYVLKLKKNKSIAWIRCTMYMSCVHSPCLYRANVIVTAIIIIIIIGVEPIHRRQIKKIKKKWYRVNVTLLFGWMTYRVFFSNFILLLYFVDCCCSRHNSRYLAVWRETSHSPLLYIRTQRFCSIPFCFFFVIFIDILSSCGYFKNAFRCAKM